VTPPSEITDDPDDGKVEVPQDYLLYPVDEKFPIGTGPGQVY
jgi:hypothetical protein